MTVTRFAPSPNGPLHLGHAFSAVFAHDQARAAGGRFLLRIEDIDGPRSRAELADQFRRDLAWLGLEWDEMPAQSTRLARYGAATERLQAMGLLYRCTCTRSDIVAAGARPGPDGLVYPGTCKGRVVDPNEPAALRLDVERALELTGPLTWVDAVRGPQSANPHALGDVVLVRKDLPASYHLAATLDDAVDGVTLVTRGADLFAASHIHRLLQALLELPVPHWHHHGLLVEPDGRKLAKRRGSGEGAMGLTERRLRGDDGRALAESLRAHHFPAGISLASS